MNIVRAALGNQCDVSAGALALVRAIIRRGDAELLNRIQRDRQHGSEGVPARLVVNVYAVERDVALVAAPAVDCSPACVTIICSSRLPTSADAEALVTVTSAAMV